MKTSCMSRFVLRLMLICICLFCGCVKYWYQEGKSFDQCRIDRNECFSELSKRTDFSQASNPYEFKFMEDCMKQKGYTVVSGSKLPLDVKREEPDPALHWRTRGIAGYLEIH